MVIEVAELGEEAERDGKIGVEKLNIVQFWIPV